MDKTVDDNQPLINGNKEYFDNSYQEDTRYVSTEYSDHPPSQLPPPQQPGYGYDQPTAPVQAPQFHTGYGYGQPQATAYQPVPTGSEYDKQFEKAPQYQPPPQQQGYGYDQPPQYPGYDTNQPGQPVIVTTPHFIGNPVVTQATEIQVENINDHMCYSVFVCIFCCWIIGIFAIMKSCAVRDQLTLGNYALAKKYSADAKKIATIALVVGIIIIILNAVITAVRIVLVQQDNNNYP